MKTEKGDRKLSVNRASAIYLVIGLVLILAGTGYFKLDVAACAPLFFAYVAGIVGKDSAFVWGNAKEHLAAASALKPPAPPAL